MFISAHLHLSHPHILSSTSHIFTSRYSYFSLLRPGAVPPERHETQPSAEDRACRGREMQARVRFVPVRRNPLRRSRVSSARNAGESAICPGRGQSSAEIARVERAKCRRECDLSRSRATFCGDRACRVREMQARVRFVLVAGNPLRRSCVSRMRNAGESAIWFCRAQPFAEIVCVECAKCRRECDLVLFGATLCGDRACRGREMQARVRFGFVGRNPLPRSCVSSARNAGENGIWFCPAQPSAEIVCIECAKCRRQSDESYARTYLGSWKMRTGDILIQL